MHVGHLHKIGQVFFVDCTKKYFNINRKLSIYFSVTFNGILSKFLIAKKMIFCIKQTSNTVHKMYLSFGRLYLLNIFISAIDEVNSVSYTMCS